MRRPPNALTIAWRRVNLRKLRTKTAMKTAGFTGSLSPLAVAKRVIVAAVAPNSTTLQSRTVQVCCCCIIQSEGTLTARNLLVNEDSERNASVHLDFAAEGC